MSDNQHGVALPFQMFFVPATLISRPELMQDLPDRNALKGPAVAGLVQTEPGFINRAGVTAVLQFLKMFARISFFDPAAGPATRA